MDTGVGLVGLIVVAIVIWVVFKLLKSLVKATMVGFVVLLLVGAWLAYRAGLVGW
jgi:hypothetical protein